MSNDAISRGNHLKAFRKSKKMTLKTLSEETGLSVGFLSKIENGTGNPSINNVQKICYALGITANDLMTPQEDKERMANNDMDTSYIMRKSDRCLLYDFSGLVRFESIFEGNPHFKLDVLTLKGDTSKCFSSMHSYDELGIVAQGSLRVVLNQTEEYVLEEGEAILIRSQTPHSLSSNTDGLCTSYWIEMSQEE